MNLALHHMTVNWKVVTLDTVPAIVDSMRMEMRIVEPLKATQNTMTF